MQIGTSVGPYRILSHLGSGGMGEVWLAEDMRLQRRVALKMVRPASLEDRGSRERLMREARAAAALNHPHIATVHDVLEEQGEVVVVFEYVEGETLHVRIARERIPVDEAVDIASQIVKALAAAHSHGIVHRDLKPANVIIGADRHVKVLDFGIARILAIGSTESTGKPPAETMSGLGFIGTAGYAAPEQMVSSAVDERADLYALGVVLFEMISGRRPFPGNDRVHLASVKLATDAPPLSSTGQVVPPPLEQLIASLLERDRDRRPATAQDVLSELRTIAGSTNTGPFPAVPARRSWKTAAVAVSIVVLAGFGLWGTRYFRAAPSGNASAPPVVAVLPLTNISGDPSRDFVAAGIAESLISSLAAVPSVTVLSRAAVNDAKLRTADTGALTKDLGATYLVEGSVQESSGTLRVSLHLVRSDRSVAWGDIIEGKFEAIFELQSKLAMALTNALVVRVSASELERINAQPTSSPQALSAYWQGKALLERADVKGNVDAAVSAFEQAAKLDPKFALAHTGLAEAYRQRYLDVRDPIWAQQAIDEATHALSLDPNRAEVRYVLGLTLAGGGRLDDASAELYRALALQPNYEDARTQLGQLFATQGNIDAAIIEFRKAIALRPTSPAPYSAMGVALVNAARYEEAVQVLSDAAERFPDNSRVYQQLGTAHQFLGNTEQAVANYRKALAIRPSAPAYSNLGAFLHSTGDFAGAVDAYQHAIEIRPNSPATRRNLGDALTRLGRVAEAKEAYREAVRLSEAELKVNPTDARNLAALAVYLQKAGEPAASRTRLEQALATAPDSADILFRASVLHALWGESDRALDFLERAAANGYSRKTIETDDDLASLRQSPRFKQLLKE